MHIVIKDINEYSNVRIFGRRTEYSNGILPFEYSIKKYLKKRNKINLLSFYFLNPTIPKIKQKDRLSITGVIFTHKDSVFGSYSHTCSGRNLGDIRVITVYSLIDSLP